MTPAQRQEIKDINAELLELGNKFFPLVEKMENMTLPVPDEIIDEGEKIGNRMLELNARKRAIIEQAIQTIKIATAGILRNKN